MLVPCSIFSGSSGAPQASTPSVATVCVGLSGTGLARRLTAGSGSGAAGSGSGSGPGGGSGFRGRRWFRLRRGRHALPGGDADLPRGSRRLAPSGSLQLRHRRDRLLGQQGLAGRRCQQASAREAPGGVLGHAAGDHRVQGRRHALGQAAGPRRAGVQVGVDDAGRSLPSKGGAPVRHSCSTQARE